MNRGVPNDAIYDGTVLGADAVGGVGVLVAHADAAGALATIRVNPLSLIRRHHGRALFLTGQVLDGPTLGQRLRPARGPDQLRLQLLHQLWGRLRDEERMPAGLANSLEIWDEVAQAGEDFRDVVAVEKSCPESIPGPWPPELGGIHLGIVNDVGVPEKEIEDIGVEVVRLLHDREWFFECPSHGSPSCQVRHCESCDAILGAAMGAVHT